MSEETPNLGAYQPEASAEAPAHRSAVADIVGMLNQAAENDQAQALIAPADIVDALRNADLLPTTEMDFGGVSMGLAPNTQFEAKLEPPTQEGGNHQLVLTGGRGGFEIKVTQGEVDLSKIKSPLLQTIIPAVKNHLPVGGKLLLNRAALVNKPNSDQPVVTGVKAYVYNADGKFNRAASDLISVGINTAVPRLNLLKAVQPTLQQRIDATTEITDPLDPDSQPLLPRDITHLGATITPQGLNLLMETVPRPTPPPRPPGV